ncbi:glycoside hydrolase family 16 protein [Niveibacterium sp. SC-1]|uniref:glycoside hydrolase family 16 protein n=1 Tax=Niveibacterium sp. SC-1 TaxID=3135646 RepID=UPI00311E515E
MKSTTCAHLLAVLMLACGLSACGGSGSESGSAQVGDTQLPAGGVPGGWKLAWSDEFDADGLPDPGRWDYDTERNGDGWYNGELQYYARDRAENAVVKEGRLVISALKEDLSAMPDWGGQRYSSARLVTRGKASWTYGFYEIRARLPCGRGTWPAIWMLGTGGAWPDDGEIDIMEQVGSAPSSILGTIHTRLFNHAKGTQRGASTQVSSACSAFHNYQLYWTRDRILVGVDNSYYFRFDNPGGGLGGWPFDKPQYLLLNLAIGGTLGGAVEDLIFPVQMEVDYVRVYQAGS